jgi:hypothetical protein
LLTFVFAKLVQYLDDQILKIGQENISGAMRTDIGLQAFNSLIRNGCAISHYIHFRLMTLESCQWYIKSFWNSGQSTNPAMAGHVYEVCDVELC